MSKLRQLVATFSPWRPGFMPRLVHTGFVVDKVALGQVFVRVLWFFHVSIIPLMFHIHSCIMWGIGSRPLTSPVLERQSHPSATTKKTIKYRLLSILSSPPHCVLFVLWMCKNSKVRFKTLHSQARKIIDNVHTFMEWEARISVHENVKNIGKRTLAATEVSESRAVFPNQGSTEP
jgi:hypothetical protein